MSEYDNERLTGMKYDVTQVTKLLCEGAKVYTAEIIGNCG